MSKCSRCGFKPTASPVPDPQQSAWDNLHVLDLIRSGYAPPSAIAPTIPGRIAALEARHESMNGDLISLLVLVARLREEMEATEVEIEQTQSLAAPIRSLPREILLHIFSFTISSPTLHPSKAPCSLGHVCKFWRTLSRSALCLWSNIEVLDPDGPGKMLFSKQVLQQHLVLSNPRPLRIVMFLGVCRTFGGCPRTEDVMEVLSGHINRAHSLSISGGDFEVEEFLRILANARLRVLKSLAVCIYRGSLGGRSLKRFSFVLPPPLQSLEMNIPLNAFNTVTVQWSSLISFTGPFSASGSFLRFVAEACNLVRLKIICIGDAEDNPNNHPRAVLAHQNLTDLTLSPSCSMSPALDQVTFPRLVRLIIDDDHDGSHDTCPLQPREDWGVLNRLLDRSQCTLRNFVATSSLPSQALTSLWRMSHLESLTLFLDSPVLDYTAILLDALTVTPSQQHLPRLRALTIVCDADVNHLFTDSKLMDLLASRWEVPTGVQRLAELSLANPSSPYTAYETLPVALYLLDLEDKGLKVSWATGDVENVLKEARKARDSYF